MARFPRFLVVSVLVLSLSACASKTQTGAVVGAGSGAVVGGVIGRAAGNTAAGAIIGAVVGGAAGAYIGRYMDRQAEEIERDLEGAHIERIGEGIKITFDSGILFAVDRSNLQGVARQNLSDLATILNKYDDTNVLIEGHTDATGADDYNMGLSDRRAQAVADHLASVQVTPDRFTIMAYGETQPIADNSTADGRQENRRVEIAIWANDDLKDAARRQG